MTVKKQAAIGFIFITLLIDVIGLGIIIPVMPKLIQGMIGGSMSDAARYGGWLMFTYAIMQFLFSPILGGLSDRYGRRPILLISLLGLGIDYIFLAFAPSIFWLFVGRLISGICGASFTTGAAYIADVSPPEKRAQNFGMIGAAFGLGFIIGPVIGGLLGQYGASVPFLAAAALSLLNCAFGFFILPESLDQEHRREFEWKRANPISSVLNLRKYPSALSLVGSLFFIYLAGFALQSTWSYFTIEAFNWDEKMIGYSLGFVGIMVAGVQGGLIRVINPLLGQKRSVYYGLALNTIGFVLFAFASEGWMMFAILIPYCLGGIGGPALQGIISNQVPANAQGELQGSLTSIMSITSIIGPVLMTGLFARFTAPEASFKFPGAPFMMGAILCLVSLIFAMRSLSKHSESKAGNS